MVYKKIRFERRMNMNKKAMVFFATAFILGGCASQKANAPVVESSDSAAQSSDEMVKESSSESKDVESSAVVESSTEAENEADMAPVSEEEAEQAEKVTDISQYEELEYSKGTIDLSGYESRLLTDNQGTRVMLFSKDNEQLYKTIYVKNNHWLKLIDLKADKLLLNESIK